MMQMSDDKKVEIPADQTFLDAEDEKSLEKVREDAEQKNLDTTADMNQIKTNIDDIKKSVESLKNEMDNFEKNKNILTKEIIDQKQKDIEAKKVEIEKKKTETQELIAKIRKERVDLKLETLDDATKKLLIEQKNKDETLLAQYEKELQTIEPQGQGWRGKIKTGTAKVRERVKEHKKPLLIATGIGIGVVGLIAWIRNRRKKKQAEAATAAAGTAGTVEAAEKPFWKRPFGKFLMGAGIGVAGFFGIKRLINQFNKGNDKDEGNDTEIPGTLRDTKNAVESFEAIKEPQTKEVLNEVGNGVNDLYDYVYKFDDGSTPSDLTKEKLGAGQDKYAGVIPHVLDNTFTTINDISSEQGLFMVGAYGDAVEVAKRFAELLSKGMTLGTTWLVNSTLGMIGFSNVIGETTEEAIAIKIQTFLTGENKLEEVHLIYRKIFKTMSYLNYAENAFLGQKIEKLLSGGAVLYEKSGEDRDVYEYDKDPEAIKRLVKKISEDPDEFKIGDVEVESMRIKDFRSKKIKDVATLGMANDTILQYNPEIAEDVQDLNDKRKEKLALLDKDPDKVLDKMTELAKKEMGDSFYKSLAKIIPVTHLMELFGVGREDEVKQKIMEKGGYKELLDSYTAEFQKMKGQDKTKIKTMIDKYYAQLKEITVTTASIYESQDENGNWVLHCVTPVWNLFTGYVTGSVTGVSMVVRGVGEIAEGEVGKGLGNSFFGLVLASGSVGFRMLFFRRTRILGLKLVLRPYAVPAKLIRKAAKPYAKVGTSEMFSPWVTQKIFRLYKDPESIMKGLLRGMSVKSAFKLFEMQSKVTAGVEAKFLREVLLLEHELPAQKIEFAMMEDLLKSKKFGVLNRMIDTKGWIIIGTKKISMQASMDAMTPIYTKVLKSGTRNVKTAGYKLLERLPIAERGKVEKLLDNSEIIAELNKIKNINDIPGITKALAKSLSETDDVDAAIDACKIIIKNRGIEKAAGGAAEVLSAEKILVRDIVTKDLKAFKELDSVKNAPSGSAVKAFNEKQIARMDDFLKNEVKNLTKEEADAFQALSKGKFQLKAYHVLECLDLKTLGSVGKVFKDFEKDADVVKLAKGLRNLKASTAGAVEISEDLIKAFERTEFKSVMKGTVEAVEFATHLKVLKGLAKII